MTRIQELHEALRGQVAKVVIGHEDALRLIVIALVCDGHVLLEGVPGVAKTTLVRTLARALGLEFRRVQFTPDLMPSDIIGAQVFNFHEGTFHLVEGPVFTNLLLADEINRAPVPSSASTRPSAARRSSWPSTAGG